MTNPIHSSTTSRDSGLNPAVPNPAINNPAMADALSGAVGSDTPVAHSRIDQSADRVKQATSDAVARTKQAVNTTADKVEAGVHRATDKAASTAHLANDKAADLAERSRELRDDAMDKADLWMTQARQYVREKPMQSIAIAAGAGWLLGRLLRR